MLQLSSVDDVSGFLEIRIEKLILIFKEIISLCYCHESKCELGSGFIVSLEGK